MITLKGDQEDISECDPALKDPDDDDHQDLVVRAQIMQMAYFLSKVTMIISMILSHRVILNIMMLAMLEYHDADLWRYKRPPDGKRLLRLKLDVWIFRPQDIIGGLFKYHDDDVHIAIIRFDQNFDCSQLPHMDEFSSDVKGKPAWNFKLFLTMKS